MMPEQFFEGFEELIKEHVSKFPLKKGDSSLKSPEDGVVAWSSNSTEGKGMAQFLRVERQKGVLIVEGCLMDVDFALHLDGEEEGLYLGTNQFKKAPAKKETVIKVLEEVL